MKINYSRSSLFFALFVLVMTAAVIVLAVQLLKLKKSVKPVAEYNLQVNSGLLRKSDRLIEIQHKLAQKKDVEEDLCKLEVEEGTEVPAVAAAYDCLMRIYAKSNDELKIYQAIEMGSYALDIDYNPKYVQNLYNIIAGRSMDISGLENMDKEIGFLNQLAGGSDPAVAARAFNRLSMIYKLGRNSSMVSKSPPDIRAAAKARTGMMEYFKSYPADKKVEIALIVNDKYVSHAAVTMASALLNARPDTFYTFYFIENPNDSISQENRNKLLELANLNKNHEVIFILFPNDYLDENLLKKYPKSFESLPYLITYRLFLDQLFPELKQMIYLDSDIIVKRDLNLLKEKITDTYSLAAVEDPEFIKITMLRKNMGKILKTYVNSGVVAFNLEKMRMEGSADKIIDTIAGYKHQPGYFDQDTINYVYENKIKLLPRRWNMTVGANFRVGNAKDTFCDFITHFIQERPGIESAKPWHYPDGEKIWQENPAEMLPEFQDYWAYRDVTPWSVRAEPQT